MSRGTWHCKPGAATPQDIWKAQGVPDPGLGFSSSTNSQEQLMFVCLVGFSETRSHNLSQAGLEPSILLSQPPECWDGRRVPPHPAQGVPFWVLKIYPVISIFS
jgi:hypothetical protein